MAINFDNIKAGAKDILDKAAAKANEAIDYSKTQIDRGQLRAKIKEDYCKLGKICYDMHDAGDDRTGEMKQIISEISDLKAKLEEADAAVNAKKTKECKFCGTANDATSDYCTKCGEKL